MLQKEKRQKKQRRPILLRRGVQWIEQILNNLKMQKKLRILYIYCMLVPLILTDSVILYAMIHAEEEKQLHEMQNLSSAVQYNISGMVGNAAGLAKNIYMNDYLEEFLNQEYKSPYDFFVAYQAFINESMFKSSLGIDNTKVTIYADNDKLINGGEFGRLSSVEDTSWFQRIEQSGRDSMLHFFYDDWNDSASGKKRRLLFVRRLNRVTHNSCDKIVKIEIDYGNFARSIQEMNNEAPLYICQDNKILVSNLRNNHVGEEYPSFTQFGEIAYKDTFNLYGEEYTIYILKTDSLIFRAIKDNMVWVLLLLAVNTVFPGVFMKLIASSITVRIEELSHVFENGDQENLKKIEQIDGVDEIGMMMRHYNYMADRMNELIQTVYKDRLKQQEIDIARQKAELQALHSQINPHFMFNALESIRMHSIIKQEYETASMVEKLAKMQRTNVDWSMDILSTRKEMEFVDAYLSLQKYRFGERLSYSIEVDEECEEYKIPKLSIATFVENACVHGIENKDTQCWIFVRVFMEGEDYCIEIEDTGGGMDEDACRELQEKMEHASIDKLKQRGRVGVLNACLRLKMVSNEQVSFSVESEVGIGTIVTIKIHGGESC